MATLRLKRTRCPMGAAQWACQRIPLQAIALASTDPAMPFVEVVETQKVHAFCHLGYAGSRLV